MRHPPVYRLVFLVILATSFGLKTSHGHTAASDSLSFQGFVVDEFGVPIDTASVSILFKIYKGDVAVWEETHPGVAISNGILNVLLGAITPMDTVAFKGPMTVGITIGDDEEISPRTPLAATAYARALPGFYTYFRDDGLWKSYNVVGGHTNNVVDPDAAGVTISGGGGFFNATPLPNSASADFATIGGGYSNTASGSRSTISGGTDNTATLGYATVGGGWNNDATHDYAVVAGGRDNVASGDRSSVLGGANSTATDQYASVVGGANNAAGGPYSAVGGGANNIATGDASVVPGGSSNAARGITSFAAGRGAKANHDRSFVWNGGAAVLGDTLETSMTDQFLARASNGFTFYTNSALSTGVTIGANGGSWGSVSDVNAKNVFGSADPIDVLEKLVALRIPIWRYKGQDESVVHMGPTAQDFRESFGLGYDDRHIVTVDADGVSFAAIQGLYKLLIQQQAEIERLQGLVEGE